jgi:hypothetical protein
LALRTADLDTQLLDLSMGLRTDRMVHPAVVDVIDVKLGAEGEHAFDVLCPVIDHGAALAGERPAILIAFKEVLPEFRADGFEHETEMAGDRIVPQNRMFCLGNVQYADNGQGGKNPKNPKDMRVDCEAEDEGHNCGCTTKRKHRIAGWKQETFSLWQS